MERGAGSSDKAVSRKKWPENTRGGQRVVILENSGNNDFSRAQNRARKRARIFSAQQKFVRLTDSVE
jgi:hypothetical protein